MNRLQSFAVHSIAIVCLPVFYSAAGSKILFVATKTSRMPAAPGKLAFCARWLQKGKLKNIKKLNDGNYGKNKG
jgi:hypothetical protein